MHKTLKFFLLIFAIVAIILIVTLNNHGGKSPATVSNNDAQPQKEVIPTAALPALKTGQKRYTSPKLGVSFVYLDNQDGLVYSVKEAGNKIYIYNANTKPEDGQYLEIFTKSSSDSLLSALGKTIMAKYSLQDCEVYSMENKWNYPSSYTLASIKVTGEVQDLGELETKRQKCPQPYTESNGLSYFLADTQHPTKFAFLSVGQYPIFSWREENHMQVWQSTIQFVD